MAQDPLEEIVDFLKPETRVDLKHVALEHLVGISASDEGINTLVKNEKVLRSIIELTRDKVEEIAKTALLLLVNVSANAKGASELLKLRLEHENNIIELLIGYVLNPQKKDADAACMILSNFTRLEEEVEACLDTFLPHLNDLLNVFVNLFYNKRESNLNYLAPMFCNLSRCKRIRKWLVEENPHVPLIKLLPFCNYGKSSIRKGGTVSLIRNLSFDIELHNFLLSPDLDLFTYILKPLMGNEEYVDDEMDQLPISLQYLPKTQVREQDPDIKKIILETLNKLCTKRNCREILRANGVYYVLRELHKVEKDPEILLACENVIDILIQKEEEVGAEDFSTVEVPEEMVDKFKKMDEDYLKNCSS